MSAKKAFKWKELDGYEHLVGGGMTFRVHQTGSNGSNDPAYAYLQLLTSHGWTNLRKVYLGDSYYGYHKNGAEQVTNLKRYAEGLISIGATVSGAPKEIGS